MLTWEGDEVVIDGHRFRAIITDNPVPNPEAIPVFKTPNMIDQLAAHVREHRPERILELGIYFGGSAMLLSVLAPQAKVVALDIRENGTGPLAQFIEQTQRQDRIRPYYGIDQADRGALQQIIADEFGGAPLDLVIDDASHELDRTRASLDIVAPHLRPGGCYLIEDWSWGYLSRTEWGREMPLAQWPEGPPMTPLVHDLLATVGQMSAVFTRIDLDFAILRAWRGGATLDPETFSLADEARLPEGDGGS